MQPDPGGSSQLSADSPISSLGLSARPRNALARMGVNSVGELIALPRKQVLKARGMGAASMREIETALGSHGLQLGAADQPPAAEAENFSPLLQRPLAEAEWAALDTAGLTSLPGKPGGRVRTLLERTHARTLSEVARLDPTDLRRLPNVGTKTVDALQVLLAQWLRDNASPEPVSPDEDDGPSTVLGRELTADEAAAAAEVRLALEGGRPTLLHLVQAEPAAPTEAAAERAAQRAEALLLAARFARTSPSEFFGHLLEAAHLTPREALVMRLRWGIGTRAESLREVGSRFKLSGEWARRLEASMTDRLREHMADEQIKQYARGLAGRVRWSPARWGIMSRAEMVEGLRTLLGGETEFEELAVLCEKLAGARPLQLVGEVWPRDPAAGWFARNEELLRLAQAFAQTDLEEETTPALTAWQARLRSVLEQERPEPEEDEEESAEDLAEQVAGSGDSDGDHGGHAAEEAPTSHEPAVREEVDARAALEAVAHEPEGASPGSGSRGFGFESESTPVEPAAGRPPARDFVAGFLREAGGSAPIAAVVAAGKEAGYRPRRIESVCRKLPRRFEVRKDRVYLL